MSDEKKHEPQPMRAGAKASDRDGPRTSTISFDPDDRASVDAAIRRLKMARDDLDARDRAEAEKRK